MGEDLYIGYDFWNSNLPTSIQNSVVAELRMRFIVAGVKVVQSYFVPRYRPPEKELRVFDTYIVLHYTPKDIGAHGANRMVVALISNEADISWFLVRGYKNPRKIVNHLVNVSAHEAVHASRTIPEYDHDAMGGVGGQSGSPCEQGVSASEFARAIREFHPWEAAQIREMLNPPVGKTISKLLKRKQDEIRAARSRR
jgi:hypothetical protein